MRVFVVFDNVSGEAPRVFSTLDKAKFFCETQKEHYFDLYPAESCFYDGDIEVTEKGFADWFLIESAEVDDYSNYDFE